MKKLLFVLLLPLLLLVGCESEESADRKIINEVKRLQALDLKQGECVNYNISYQGVRITDFTMKLCKN